MALLAATGLTALLLGSGYYMGNNNGKVATLSSETVQRELALLRMELTDYHQAKQTVEAVSSRLTAFPVLANSASRVPKAELTNLTGDLLTNTILDLMNTITALENQVATLENAYENVYLNLLDTETVVTAQTAELEALITRITSMDTSIGNTLTNQAPPTYTYTSTP